MSVAADVLHLSYERAQFAPSPFTGLASSLSPVVRDDARPTLLPPVQPACRHSASDELDSPSAAADDDTVPPVVRFKNRYRRAQQLEEQQQQLLQRQQLYHEETSTSLRDWNDNVTVRRHVKTDWNPADDYHAVDDIYCDILPPKISPDPEDLEKRCVVAEESRTCEKRAWSRITPEADLSDPWMASSKIPCRGDTAVSGLHTEQRESDQLLMQYQQIRQRSLDCHQNCADSRAESNCKSLIQSPSLPLLVRPKTIVFGRTYVLLQMFFSPDARSPRCVGRPA